MIARFYPHVVLVLAALTTSAFAQTLDTVKVTAPACATGEPIFSGGDFQGCYYPTGSGGPGVGPGNQNGGGGGGGGGSGGGSGTPATLNANGHTNCVTAVLEGAHSEGDSSTPASQSASQPIPIAYANPINVANGSQLESIYGGVNGTRGNTVIFPNLAAGFNAAKLSLSAAGLNGKTVSFIINKWAPSTQNPNAMPNTLAGMGMSQADADNTLVSQLNEGQKDQLIGAFAWQEGFKPTGC